MERDSRAKHAPDEGRTGDPRRHVRGGANATSQVVFPAEENPDAEPFSLDTRRRGNDGVCAGMTNSSVAMASRRQE